MVVFDHGRFLNFHSSSLGGGEKGKLNTSKKHSFCLLHLFRCPEREKVTGNLIAVNFGVSILGPQDGRNEFAFAARSCHPQI
jgi:hypothetical protein